MQDLAVEIFKDCPSVFLGVWTVVGGGNTLHMRPMLLALVIVGLACY